MEGGRDGRERNGVFGAGDPFAGFGGGFGPFGGSMPSLFGGRDPFDDPFFTQPFGGRIGGPGMFGPSLFGPMGGPGMFGAFGPGDAGFLQQAPPPPPRSNNGGRPVITEIDDDEEEGGDGERQPNHGAYVQEPDDGNDGMHGGQVQLRGDTNRANSGGQPQSRTFTYQSSSVTYGGINGAYYTSSKTRRSGSDGITMEEGREADTTTKEATHRLVRRDLGPSLSTRTVLRGDFFDPSQIHLASVDLTGPPSSAGRSGGGRLGEPHVTGVYSVGAAEFSAGGALRWAARPVVSMRVVLALFDAGALRSSAARRLLLRAPGPLGPSGVPNPLPDLRAADPVDDFEATDDGARGWIRRRRVEAPRSSRPEDFPLAWGYLSFQGLRRDEAAARHRHVLLCSGDIELFKDWGTP